MDKTILTRPLRIAAAAALSLLWACDSGDIQPKEHQDDEGIAVEATFNLLSPEAFPVGYNFVFGVFASGGRTPLSSVNVLKPADGEPLRIKLENIPEESASAKLCTTNAARQVLYTFFEYEIDGDGPSDIVIPAADVELLKYDRLQMIFTRDCTSCHGQEPAPAGLLLTAGNSYSRLVGVASKNNPAKLRAAPGDVANSFLWDVLNEDGALRPSHTGYIANTNDVDLLRIWIEAGCPDN